MTVIYGLDKDSYIFINGRPNMVVHTGTVVHTVLGSQFAVQ